MRYDDPDLRDRLAAEYALGTLRGAARRRFQWLMQGDRALADAVEQWELRLNTLAEAAPAVEPPPRVWAAIENEIGSLETREATVISFPGPDERGARRRIGMWRGFAVAASAVAAVLAIYIAVRQPESLENPVVAVLSDEGGHAAFVVTVTHDSRKLALARIAANEPGAQHVYQLWLLPARGGKPRSIGILSDIRRATFQLSQDDAKVLPNADGIAISVEPPGGSPTGLPTGPIQFKGSVIAR